MTQRGPAATIFAFPDGWEAIDAHYQERGWTDGLPIVPPTEEMVAEFLTQTDRDPQVARAAERAVARLRAMEHKEHNGHKGQSISV